MATQSRLRGTATPRVLFALDEFPGPYAGTEGQFWLLFRKLRDAGVDCGIMLLRPSQFLIENITDVPVKVLNVMLLRSPVSWSRAGLGVAWAKRSGYDVCHIFLNDSSVILPPLLRAFGIPVVVSRRDLGFWYTGAVLRLLRFNARWTDAVVANCNAVKDTVVGRENVPANRVQVIYNAPVREGGWSESKLDLCLPSGALVIVIVANLRPLKRIPDAIDALSQLAGSNRDVHLVVAGEDRDGRSGSSHRDELEALAMSRQVRDRVHLIGAVEDPRPLLELADICLLCSETEGLSNAVIEYMLAGKPVVCTDVGGNAELVKDGVNGYVVPVGAPDKLADALESLLESGTLRATMGSRSRSLAAEMFDTNRMVEQHLSLYRSLVAAV